MSTKRVPPPAPKVDFSLATDVKCDNCGNFTFAEILLLKHFSDVASPSGKAGFVPIPTFGCNSCGFINNAFLPAHMQTAPATTSLETVDEPATPSKLIL